MRIEGVYEKEIQGENSGFYRIVRKDDGLVLVFWKDLRMMQRFSDWLRPELYSYVITGSIEVVLEILGRMRVEKLFIDLDEKESLALLEKYEFNEETRIFGVTGNRRIPAKLKCVEKLEKVIFKPVVLRVILRSLENMRIDKSPTVKIKEKKETPGQGRVKWLDEAEEVVKEYRKSGKKKKDFVKKKKSVSWLDQLMRLERLPGEVKAMIRENPEIFLEKKSLYAEKLYKENKEKIKEITSSFLNG